jgi:multisite-specific tRNA:(cytosine-C5)-methyltransferase
MRPSLLQLSNITRVSFPASENAVTDLIHTEFELVDVSDRFPELKRRPGLTTWRPTHDRDIVSTFETYEEHLRTLSSGADLGFGKVESKMTEQHWPPSQEDAVTLGLSRCIRIYPHLQDTGAFFVAVLQKKDQGQTSVGDRTERKREAEEDVAIDAPEPKKARLGENEATGIGNEAMEIVVESENVNTSGVDTSDQTKALKKKKKASETGGVFKENPYTFLSPDDPILQSCIKRLNLTPGFPSSNVLVRNPEGDAVRSLYLTNDIVKTIVLHNDYNRLRLTACGTKVFAKQEAGKGIEAQFRVLGEGLPVVLPYIDPESIMTADVSALKTLTQASYPLCASFNGPFRADIESRRRSY